jgi:hypothetical protein
MAVLDFVVSNFKRKNELSARSASYSLPFEIYRILPAWSDLADGENIFDWLQRKKDTAFIQLNFP